MDLISVFKAALMDSTKFPNLNVLLVLFNVQLAAIIQQTAPHVSMDQ